MIGRNQNAKFGQYSGIFGTLIRTKVRFKHESASNKKPLTQNHDRFRGLTVLHSA